MSNTRIYIGGLSSRTGADEVQRVFGKFGKIGRVDLKNGYAFVEYEDGRDAADAAKEMDGRDVDGRRVVVESAKGRRNDRAGVGGRNKSQYRVLVEGLDSRTSWQDLKDFARACGSVAFTDVFFDKGKKTGVIEYSNRDEMEEALRKLDNTKLDGVYVRLYQEKSGDRDDRGRSPPRGRSRSPPRRNDDRKDDRPRRSSRSRSRGRDQQRGDRHDRSDRNDRNGRNDRNDRDREPAENKDRAPARRSRSPRRDDTNSDRDRAPARRSSRSPRRDDNRDRKPEPKRDASPRRDSPRRD